VSYSGLQSEWHRVAALDEEVKRTVGDVKKKGACGVEVIVDCGGLYVILPKLNPHDMNCIWSIQHIEQVLLRSKVTKDSFSSYDDRQSNSKCPHGTRIHPSKSHASRYQVTHASHPVKNHTSSEKRIGTVATSYPFFQLLLPERSTMMISPFGIPTDRIRGF